MFRNRRQLRRWTARVLLLWLFGVATGVANTCWAGSLARLESQHHNALNANRAIEVGKEAPECELHAPRHVALAADAGDHHSAYAQSHCQTYCDISSLSFSPLKSALDNTAGPALPAPSYAIALPSASDSPIHLLMPRGDGSPAPPITIAFLRLTL